MLSKALNNEGFLYKIGFLERVLNFLMLHRPPQNDLANEVNGNHVVLHSRLVDHAINLPRHASPTWPPFPSAPPATASPSDQAN